MSQEQLFGFAGTVVWQGLCANCGEEAYERFEAELSHRFYRVAAPKR